MAVGLVRGEPAGVDELLDDGVVDAHLLQDAVDQPVDARVADVEDEPVRLAVLRSERDTRDRGARGPARTDGAADPVGGTHEAVLDVLRTGRGTPGEHRELLDGDAAGQVARGVPAHAVRDEEDRRLRRASRPR